MIDSALVDLIRHDPNYTAVHQPYLDNPAAEALFCLLDRRRVVGAIHNRRRAGDVVVRG